MSGEEFIIYLGKLGKIWQNLFYAASLFFLVEVEQMLEKRCVSLLDFPQIVGDTLPGLENSAGHYGGGAGGYLEFILRGAANNLFEKEVDNVEYKVIR